MEVQTAAQLSCGSPSAASPPWVLLEEHCKMKKLNEDPSTADASTLVTARTTTGNWIQAYLRLAEPPASSALWVHFPDDDAHRHDAYTTIIAAHKDSLLIQVQIKGGYFGRRGRRGLLDHFVYNAGAAARPPSLSLLPPYYPTDGEQIRWSPRLPTDYTNRYRLQPEATGILRRRGEDDEVVVAELQMVAASEYTHA